MDGRRNDDDRRRLLLRLLGAGAGGNCVALTRLETRR